MKIIISALLLIICIVCFYRFFSLPNTKKESAEWRDKHIRILVKEIVILYSGIISLAISLVLIYNAF